MKYICSLILCALAPFVLIGCASIFGHPGNVVTISTNTKADLYVNNMYHGSISPTSSKVIDVPDGDNTLITLKRSGYKDVSLYPTSRINGTFWLNGIGLLLGVVPAVVGVVIDAATGNITYHPTLSFQLQDK